MIIRFEKVGNRVQAIAENHIYNPVGAGESESLATRQSFAESVIFTAEILSEENGRVLINLNDLLTADLLNLTGTLSGAGQGSFSLSDDLSTPLFDQALAFPMNVEIDARVTLTGSEPGSEVNEVAAYPRSFTLVQHHSFAALPEPGFEPRIADVRAGNMGQTSFNTAADLSEPIIRVLAERHRLERSDPEAESSPAVEPIIYYVDSGAPAAVREALVEGGSWWNEAFEAAGYENAFRVEVMPEGAHPLDIRYNTIQWVHRQTRGWSYGQSVIDPRTGEIIKGAVVLGSQRVRQDRMIFEGLLGAGNTGTGRADDPIEIALSRIRQLSAHEIGHTLGIAHNFSASTNDRASVMDYPAPLITVNEDGSLNASQAYDTGIGEWDIAVVRWLYTDFPDGTDEDAARNDILEDAKANGLEYISDRHARGLDSAIPEASLWDNGDDPVSHLEEVLAVRNTGLANFGTDNLAEGRPFSELRSAFVPIYLYHRYQTEAAAKAIGGRRFEFQINSEPVRPVQTVPASEQRRALDLVLQTLEPEFLAVDEAVLNLLQPDVYLDYEAAAQRELFDSASYPTLSPLDLAQSSAAITIQAALSPGRLSRVVDQSLNDPAQLDLDELFDSFQARIFRTGRNDSQRETAVRQAVQVVYVDHLLNLVANGSAHVSATARRNLEALASTTTSRWFTTSQDDFKNWLDVRIQTGLSQIDRGVGPDLAEIAIPPGSPIGMIWE